MLKDVLIELRKIKKYTQEDVAEKLNVSRQAVSKWESGQSVPDIYNCQELCRIYDISIDDLLQSDSMDLKSVTPNGKYMFGYVKIREDGSIILPIECLETMKFKPGDLLLCLGDTNQWIALMDPKGPEQFADNLKKEKEKFENENSRNKKSM